MEHIKKNYISKYSIYLIFIILSIALPISKVYNNGYNYFDFGIYLRNIYHLQYDWHYLFEGHIQPFFLLYSILLKIINADDMPLIMVLSQSLAAIYIVIKINKLFGYYSALTFILLPATWALILVDFHFEFFLLILIINYYECLLNKKYIMSFLWILSSIMIKEVYSLLIIASGLVYLIEINSARNNRERAILKTIGFFSILIGWVYFYASNAYIIPYFNPENNDFGFKASAILNNKVELGNLFLDNNYITIIYESIISNYAQKIKFIFLVYFPLIFYCDKKNIKYLILTIPFLIIVILSSLNNHNDINSHYTSIYIIPVIIALGNFNKFNLYYFWDNNFQRKFYIGIIIIVNIAFSISPISRIFWGNKIYDYNYKRYMPSSEYKEVEKLLCSNLGENNKYIVQNNFNFLCLTKSNNYLPFPAGISDLNKNDENPTYIVINKSRPLFILDKGCMFISGECQDKNIEKLYFEYLDNNLIRYNLIYYNNNILIYKI